LPSHSACFAISLGLDRDHTSYCEAIEPVDARSRKPNPRHAIGGFVLVSAESGVNTLAATILDASQI
jgi:hypothetical protein